MTGIALGLGFIAGVAIGPLAILAVFGLILARLVWPGGRALVVPALMLVAVTAIGAWRGAAVNHPSLDVPTGTSAIVGRVASDPTGRMAGQRFMLVVSGAEHANEWTAASGGVCVISMAKQAVGYGDIIQLAGAPIPADRQSAIERDYLAQRGCGGSLLTYRAVIEQKGHGLRRAIADLRQRIDDVLIGAAPGDTGALLAGLVTGSDWHLSDSRRDAFLHTSTSHITAVSGANLALLIAVLANVGGVFGTRRSIGWDLAVMLAIVGYAALTGFGAPIIRAGMVAVLALVAARLGRKPDMLTLLVLTAALMVAFNREYLWSLSFRLSFVSSLALVLTVQQTRAHGLAGWAGAGLLATAAADLATLPLIPHQSLGLPLVAIPANVLIAPLIEIAYPLACVVACVGMVSSTAASVVVVPADLLCRAVFEVVDRLDVFGVLMTGTTGWSWLAAAVAVVLSFSLVAIGADGTRFLHRVRRMPRQQRREFGWAALVSVIALSGTIVVGATLR